MDVRKVPYCAITPETTIKLYANEEKRVNCQ